MGLCKTRLETWQANHGGFMELEVSRAWLWVTHMQTSLAASTYCKAAKQGSEPHELQVLQNPEYPGGFQGVGCSLCLGSKYALLQTVASSQ